MRNSVLHLAYLTVIAAILTAAFTGLITPVAERGLDASAKRLAMIELREQIHGELLPTGGYRCCLEMPCGRCVEETHEHGQGPRCDCLADIVTGKPPCSECVGEILAGRGNPLLAEYFARALAGLAGPGDEPVLRELIERKYGLPGERSS